MNRDNEIDDIFSGKMENQIKNKIKKDRKRLNIKLIVTSVVLTLIIVIIGSFILNSYSKQYVKNDFEKEINRIMSEFTIMHPNEYIEKQGYMDGGKTIYPSYYEVSKKIGNKVIYAGPITRVEDFSKKADSNIFWKDEDVDRENLQINADIESRTSNQYGLRTLSFMYPYVDYENNINDFHFLNEIDDNKILEMVLSFDKEYTYEEINNAIDSNLTTFYWIDNNDESERKDCIKKQSIGDGEKVIGIKSTNSYSGAMIKDINKRVDKFKATVDYIKSSQYNPRDKDVDKIDLDNIKISGVVVVGSPEQIKELQNNPMIKHAVIGNVVDKF